MNRRSLVERYWQSLSGAGPAAYLRADSRGRREYGFWRRYLASLLGIRLPSKTHRKELHIDTPGRMSYLPGDAATIRAPQVHDRLEKRQDGDTQFRAAEPDDLDVVACVPQAFDRTWYPDDLLRQIMSGTRSSSMAAIERIRLARVQREYRRALVNASQLVINRNSFYNNPAIYRDFAAPGTEREAFKRLLNDGTIVPFLFTERSPAESPNYTHSADGWLAWRIEVQESAPTVLRLSWGSDEENLALIRRGLISSFDRFVRSIAELEPPLLAADLGVPSADVDNLATHLEQVKAWAAKKENVTREGVYREFVVLDATDPQDSLIDPRKPFAAEIKQLVDLCYNINISNTIDSYMFTPEGSPSRRALQEWRSWGQSQGRTDEDHLIRVLSDLHIPPHREVLALSGFENLTLGDVCRLRSTEVWESYHRSLRRFLTRPTIDDLANPHHGVSTISQDYRNVIKEAGAIATARHEASVLLQWNPAVEMTIEFAGALLSIYYNPDDSGNNYFRVARDLLPGVNTRTARAVFRLGIGEMTDSGIPSGVYNSINLLEVRLDHGRRSWNAFIRGLGRSGFLRVESVREQRVARMERSAA